MKLIFIQLKVMIFSICIISYAYDDHGNRKSLNYENTTNCPAPNITDIFYVSYFTTDSKEDITATRASLELQHYTREGLPKVYTYGMDPADKIIKEHFKNQGVEILDDSVICNSLNSKIASIEGLRDVSGMYVLYLKIDGGYLALYRENRYRQPPTVAVKLDTLFNVQKLIHNR
jgi:hypothetical protein